MEDIYAIKADRPGLSLTAGVAAVSGALPLDSKGRAPAVIRVATIGAASIHLRVGASNVAATGADLMVVGGDAILIDTAGKTHISVLQAGLSLGGLVNIYAYE